MLKLKMKKILLSKDKEQNWAEEKNTGTRMISQRLLLNKN